MDSRKGAAGAGGRPPKDDGSLRGGTGPLNSENNSPPQGQKPSGERERLPNRRASTSFNFEVAGLHYTATYSRFADGRVSELFLNNHKFGNQSDTNARDAAILLSFAAQFGADLNEIRKALCRDSFGRALGPVAKALDIILASSAREVS